MVFVKVTHSIPLTNNGALGKALLFMLNYFGGIATSTMFFCLGLYAYTRTIS